MTNQEREQIIRTAANSQTSLGIFDKGEMRFVLYLLDQERAKIAEMEKGIVNYRKALEFYAALPAKH